MPSPKDVLDAQLQSGKAFYERFTADLTDGEYFRVPVEGGNHVGWIVGHVACSEDSITAQLTGATPVIPEPVRALFKNGSTCTPGPAQYPTRGEIDRLFRDSRTRTVEALVAFDLSKWALPAPAGWEKSPFPTVGALWGLQGTHQFWHLGQITVCRQAMKKPRVL